MFSGGGSMFGSNKTFGSTTTTGGLFGSSTTPQSGFGFGSTLIDAGPEGTTIPFEPLRATDTMMKNGDAKEISTKLMCVTAMEKYKGRSLEELRVFDYAANRKGPQAGGTTFGQTATGGGLFGQTKPSIFGTQSNAFGSTTSTPFGGTSAFGQPAKPAFGSSTTTSGSLFGNTTSGTGASGGMFGTTNQSSTGSSLFGQSNAPSAFGQTTPATANIFGNKPAFGSTGQSQSQSSLFAKPASNIFGQPAATSASTAFGFGPTTTTSAPAFGSPFTGTTTSTANNNPFGKPASTGFGGFGTNSGGTTSSIFGNAQSTPGSSLFPNVNKPATAPFGGQQPLTGASPFGTGNTSSSGIFSNANKPNSLFNPNSTNVFSQNTPQQMAPTTIISQPASPPIILGGNIDEASLQRKLIEAQLGSMPYGDSPLLKGKYGSPSSPPTVSLSKSDDPDIQSRLKKLASQAIVGAETSASFNGGTPLTKLNNESLRSAVCSPHNSFSYKPLVPLPALGFAPNERSSLNLSLRRSPPKITPSKNILNLSASTIMSPRSFDPSVLKVKSNTSVLNTESSAEKSNQNISETTSPVSPTSVTPDERRRSVVFADGPNLEKISEIQPVRLDFDTSLNDSVISSKTVSSTPNQPPLKSILITAESRKQKEEQRKLSTSATHDEMEANLNTTPVSPVANRNLTKSPESPSILNRSDASLNEADEYFTEPTLDELERSMRDGKVQIKNGLTVGRKGYGSVYWPGSFELSSLDFENMVFFRSKEVTVYPDENTKPPIGIDLNRPAEISLQGVWPFDKVTKQFIKDPVAMGKLRFRNRLELVCERMDAKFIDYQVKTGTWTFSVSHFSKYGLIDEDEEISPEDLNAILKQQKQMLKVQRASIPKKGPLKEIQSTFFENSTFPTGLGGNLDAPKVKVEMVEYDVDMSDLLFQSTAKRIRQDPLIPDVLDSKFFPTSKDISYVRRKLVQRPVVNNDVISIKNNQELQYYLRKTHGFTPTIFQNNPRLQWHPSNSETLIKADRFQRRVNLYKIHLVPMLRDYFLNILTSDGRAAELDAIAETDSLKFSPPSVLLQLLDSYLLTMKKNRRLDQARVDAEIDQLLRALLVSPSSMDYKIQQRNRFSAWIKSKLQSNLKEILDKYSMEDQSDASRVIFECLIHGSVKDAIDVALKFKLYNLSLVLSLYQCPNSMQCKDNFAAQHYESERIFKHCNDEYFMKIYQLLAGPKTSKGMQRPDGFFDCLKGLSWFQIIGVFLWYASSPSDGLVEWSKFYKELASTGHVSEVL